MKKIIIIVFALLLFGLCDSLYAQRFKGIRVESNVPVEVFIDGEKICSPVYSCMIANLKRGNYFIEAFAIITSGGHNITRSIFSEDIYYSGVNTKDIFVRADNILEDPYYNGILPMDDHTFNELLSKLREASFDSDKKRLIEMAVSNSLFNTYQVRQIAEIYRFDSDRLWVLKLMYPVLVDRERAFLLQDILSFSNSKKEFLEFTKNFDRNI